MSKRLTRDLPLVKLLNISITLSPFLGVDSMHFHNSLIDGTEAYWLSLPSAPQGQLVRHWRHWTLIRGHWTLHYGPANFACLCNLYLSDPCDEPVARSFLCKIECQQSRSCELVPGQSGIPAGTFGDGICVTGGRRRESVWGASSAGTAILDRGPIHQPAGRPRHKDRRLHYCDCRNTVVLPSILSCSAFCIPGHSFEGFKTCFFWSFRSSHRPLFVRMTPLQSDWSPMGLKGIIPTLLHHTLLGYNFLIPDAVGNTTG